MDTVFGILAHPLDRRTLSLAVLGGALVSFAGSQLATMSGESLEERVNVTATVRQHAQLGEATRTLALLMLRAGHEGAEAAWAGSTARLSAH